MKIPDGFVKCDNCKSIIHNKYYKNRKYWGREWFCDEYGEYEVEYDSGECPVCGELNTELPDTGLEFQPDKSDGNNVKEDIASIFDSTGKEDITNQFTNDTVYSYDELSDLLKNLSDEDRLKVSGCKFNVFESYPDDDTGDVYYDIKVYRGSCEIGKIDMQLHSNTYFDIIDMESKTTDATPYYTYEMTLYEDSKEESRGSKSPFDDSKLRCKKCGKVFCFCNKFFKRRG